jgi:hypothetical protein
MKYGLFTFTDSAIIVSLYLYWVWVFRLDWTWLNDSKSQNNTHSVLGPLHRRMDGKMRG